MTDKVLAAIDKRWNRICYHWLSRASVLLLLCFFDYWTVNCFARADFVWWVYCRCP